MTDLDRLDGLAAAASDGPWYSATYLGDLLDMDDGSAMTREEAAFIAACDPATIRSLVAAVRERDELRAALTEIADWGAHAENCATIDPLTGTVTDKDCSCGWVEVADHAREALGLDPIGYPQSRAALHREDGA